MNKQPITEEMHLEKEWFEEAKSVKSIEELSKFVDKMLNSYEHDYGTACQAIAACSVACSWLGAHVEGITGGRSKETNARGITNTTRNILGQKTAATLETWIRRIVCLKSIIKFAKKPPLLLEVIYR